MFHPRVSLPASISNSHLSFNIEWLMEFACKMYSSAPRFDILHLACLSNSIHFVAVLPAAVGGWMRSSCWRMRPKMTHKRIHVHHHIYQSRNRYLATPPPPTPHVRYYWMKNALAVECGRKEREREREYPLHFQLHRSGPMENKFHSSITLRLNTSLSQTIMKGTACGLSCK